MNAYKKNGGFTLIEIMVVLVILGVMAALVVPRVLGRTEDARKTAAKSDISSMLSALKLYNLDNQRYPTKEQGLDALVHKPNIAPLATNFKEGGYLDKLPNDPWGRPYIYLNPGKHGEVDIYTPGPNGDANSDDSGPDVIGSWQ